MKKTLLTSIAFFAFALKIFAQNNCDNGTSFDQFFMRNPLDLGLNMLVFNYKLTDNSNNDVKGLGLGFGGSVGWRYTLLKSKEASFSTRVGTNIAYYKNKNVYNALNVQIPFTLNLSFGAGTTCESTSKFGAILGGGYSLNITHQTRTIANNQYDQTNPFLAPYIFIAFKKRTTGGVIFGVEPNFTWNKDYYIAGIRLFGDLL